MSSYILDLFGRPQKIIHERVNGTGPFREFRLCQHNVNITALECCLCERQRGGWIHTRAQDICCHMPDEYPTGFAEAMAIKEWEEKQ